MAAGRVLTKEICLLHLDSSVSTVPNCLYALEVAVFRSTF